MRLIDADALLQEMVGITDGWLKPPKDWKWYEDLVRNAPTVAKDIKVPDKWVSVKDRLPEKQGEYIAFDGKSVFGAYYEGGTLDTKWTDTTEWYRDYVVTHWMPLPKPPKEDEDD